ncbi:hypothetical protein KI387_008589, partial [Taxus chinensis]
MHYRRGTSPYGYQQMLPAIATMLSRVYETVKGSEVSFVESPIIVGISGEWGMGKSSLMIQTGSNVETETLESQYLAFRGAPRILTIRYNAWHYRDEHEAWAGIAVTITKEIEQAMTRAQKFSTCWKYSWIKNSVNICLQIFLPCLLVTFLAGWVAWAAWTLLKEAKFKDLRYGSIPCTIIAIVWVVLRQVISVVKPVSTQMMGYIIKPDHTSRLGYQQQVISDINFLKGELGKKPHWFFSFISGEWCLNWFGLYPDNVENTCVPKFSAASENQLRIITFVDDLDRCEEKVILQVLSAINLVLAECKINVVLGMDKKMIERAVRRNFEDNDDKDLADKFICKIIQIPLSLPDPTDEESNRVLRHQLKYEPPVTTLAALDDGGDTDYGELDTDYEEEENVAEIPMQERIVVDIDASSQGKVYNLPGWKVELMAWIFVCWQWKHEMNILIKKAKAKAFNFRNVGLEQVCSDQ